MGTVRCIAPPTHPPTLPPSRLSDFPERKEKKGKKKEEARRQGRREYSPCAIVSIIVSDRVTGGGAHSLSA